MSCVHSQFPLPMWMSALPPAGPRRSGIRRLMGYVVDLCQRRILIRMRMFGTGSKDSRRADQNPFERPLAVPAMAGGDGHELIRVRWHAVVPPYDMHVGPQQYQVAFVDLAHRLAGKIEHCQRRAARRECRTQ
jgi:hypothetical protein